MHLIKNTLSGPYHEFIRTLRNNERVKDGFIQQEKITKKAHLKYMLMHWYQYYLCVNDNNEPMGYIGVINNDIRICTHPDYQRMGVAKFMLDEIQERYPNAIAKVKIENKDSMKLFEKAGFKLKYYLYERA